MNTSPEANYPALTQVALAAHNASHGQAEDVAEPEADLEADPADPNLDGDFAAERDGVDFELMSNASGATSLELGLQSRIEQLLAKLREVEAQKALESKQAAEKTLQLQRELDAERARRQQADVDNARRLADERAKTQTAQQETARSEEARRQVEAERARLAPLARLAAEEAEMEDFKIDQITLSI